MSTYCSRGSAAVVRVYTAESTYARNPASYTGLRIDFLSNFSFGEFGGLLQPKVGLLGLLQPKVEAQKKKVGIPRLVSLF